MKSALIVVVLTLSSLAFGQSACQQLGVDCSHPHEDSHPSPPQRNTPPACDADCQQERQEAHERYEQRKRQEARAKEQEKEAKAQSKVIAKANKLANKAWDLLNKGQCDKAIPLYREALALTSFSPWSQNIGYCNQQLKQPVKALLEYRKVYADPTTDPENKKKVRWQMWSIMYDLGYECPELEDRPSRDGKFTIKAYPEFKGYIDGCVGVPSKVHEPTYIPMPYIEGKTWFPINYAYVGNFYAVTTDGHRWGPGDDLRKANLLNARIVTGDRAGMRLTLPDGHDFVMGANTEITLDSFVYNPNYSTTEIVIQNIKGLFRFVTATLQKSEIQTINIKLPVGSLGIRGTDLMMNQDNGIWDFRNYSGEIIFTDSETGKVITVKPGQELIVRRSTGEEFVSDIEDFKTHEPLSQTDGWDMTPHP